MKKVYFQASYTLTGTYDWKSTLPSDYLTIDGVSTGDPHYAILWNLKNHDSSKVIEYSIVKQSSTDFSNHDTSTLVHEPEGYVATKEYVFKYGSVSVPDDYVIPGDAGSSGSTNPFSFNSTSGNSATSSNLAIDFTNKVIGSMTYDNFKSFLGDVGWTIADKIASGYGVSSFVTMAHNLTNVYNAGKNAMSGGFDLLAAAGSGTDLQTYNKMLDNYMHGVQHQYNDALKDAILIPGNTTADTAVRAGLTSLCIDMALSQTGTSKSSMVFSAFEAAGKSIVLDSIGNHFFLGSANNDTIKVGSGNNVLAGGGGNDKFAFTPSTMNENTIADAHIGDVITITGASLIAGAVQTTSTIATNQVMTDNYNGTTDVWIGTSSGTKHIILNGTYQPNQMLINGTDITIVNQVATKSNTVSIAQLYQAALGRQPDKSGLDYYVSNFQTGQSLGDFANGFLNSPEFTSKFGNINSISKTTYITELYQNVLGRSPVQSEVDYYVNALASGDTNTGLLQHFAASPENATKTTYLNNMHQNTDGTWWFS